MCEVRPSRCGRGTELADPRRVAFVMIIGAPARLSRPEDNQACVETSAHDAATQPVSPDVSVTRVPEATRLERRRPFWRLGRSEEESSHPCTLALTERGGQTWPDKWAACRAILKTSCVMTSKLNVLTDQCRAAVSEVRPPQLAASLVDQFLSTTHPRALPERFDLSDEHRRPARRTGAELSAVTSRSESHGDARPGRCAGAN